MTSIHPSLALTLSFSIPVILSVPPVILSGAKDISSWKLGIAGAVTLALAGSIQMAFQSMVSRIVLSFSEKLPIDTKVIPSLT